jgi:hypothetical protein
MTGSQPTHRDAQTLPISPDDAHMAMPPHGSRLTIPPSLDAIPSQTHQTHWLACGAPLNTGLKRPLRVTSILIG